jgi:dTDP-4-amino-4,6-dideoxygalactose transaminase
VDFIDIKWGTYNMDLDLLEDRLKQAARKNRLPKVVVPVHFAGNPVDMKILDRLRKTFGFKVVEDAAHATGAEYRGERVGSCRWSDLCVFSFHAVKIITTGEGGMVTTNSPKLYESLCRLRSHGISRDSKHLKNGNNYAWYYEKLELGNHYRMTDIQAALGRSQLKKIKNMHESRAIISSSYTRSLAGFPLDLPEMTLGARSSWHLYPVCVQQGESFRNKVMNRLRSMGVMANLHYLPAQKFQFHRQKKKYKYMPCSQAEKFSHREISLPIFPALNGRDIQKVVSCLSKALA